MSTGKTPYAEVRDTAEASLRARDALHGPVVHVLAWGLTGVGASGLLVGLASMGSGSGGGAFTVALAAAAGLALLTWGISSAQSHHERVLARLREANARAVDAGEKALRRPHGTERS